jgi:hypothetical protein
MLREECGALPPCFEKNVELYLHASRRMWKRKKSRGILETKKNKHRRMKAGGKE